MLRTATRQVALATAVATAAALSVVAVDMTTAGSAAMAGGRQPSVTWTPCAEDPTAECGTLAVPIDWKDPGGPTVDLALARRKATDPSKRIGSLVINPGGPGGSGVDFAIYSTGYFSPEITSRFDIVGFDPRGVARSHPVVCSTDLLLSSPSPVITSQAAFDAMASYNRTLAADCRQRTGPLFDHVDTLSVVHDLDAIRGALGDKKLTYYGVSYGTLIGQEYAEVYGDRARALVIDSNMDHSIGTARFLMTETATDEDSFDQFAAWCARSTACALHNRDVTTVYAGLRARAAAGQLVLHAKIGGQLIDIPLDEAALPQFIFGTFYGPAWWELAGVLLAMDTGTVYAFDNPTGASASAAPSATAHAAQASSALASTVLRLGRNNTMFSTGAAESATTALATGTALAETMEYSAPIFCEDWNLPIRDYREYAAYQREMNRIAPNFGPSPIGVGITVNCLAWPGPVNNPQHPLKVRSGPTIYMTNAMHDPATAYAWATHDAQMLGDRAVLVTYEGWGHGVYGRSACVTLPVDSYLTALKLPARGTRCPAVEPGVPAGSGATGAASMLTPSAGSAPLPSAAGITAIRPALVG
jgi:pimeloyl-ACP methyl ester carboxylesterase